MELYSEEGGQQCVSNTGQLSINTDDLALHRNGQKELAILLINSTVRPRQR